MPPPDKTARAIPAPDELAALRSIVEGTANAVGDDFFRELVRNLAEALGVHHAFLSEFIPPQRIRTIAFWSNGAIVDNIEYDLPGTPCEEVIHGGFCHYSSGLQLTYPENEPGIESYLGVPLTALDGMVLGHLCVLDESPMPAEPRSLFIFKIFAARAGAELSRLRAEKQQRESEERFRDLFDEAPVAYVHEGLDSQFIRANRTARAILGLREDEVSSTRGASLAPNTPEAQRRLREAFESVGKGIDTSGVVLELNRKDNGQTVWIQWWSRPDPSGTFTRTMFVDITERILMEQEQARLKAQNSYLQEELKSVHNFGEIIGANRGLLEVLSKVRRVAGTDSSVLIGGESGTGKELIARAIHSASHRADKPFIKINCAALPAGLVESELFGHERGAFSGAIQRRLGRFELAHQGTIFLDEIGEMPLDVQVKMLRVLQEREFERVGGAQTIRTDVRVIAATNRDLPREIRDGRFRADLYYRLNVFPINLPPLRERRDDIPRLAHFFVEKHAPRIGRHIESVDPDTLQRLVSYSWPGNIRELENIIERALILASGPVLTVEPEVIGIPVAVTTSVEALASAVSDAAHPSDDVRGGGSGTDLNSIQREHIIATLTSTNWVVEGDRGAAKLLGMAAATLRHRMKKLGITRGSG